MDSKGHAPEVVIPNILILSKMDSNKKLLNKGPYLTHSEIKTNEIGSNRKPNNHI